MAWNDHNKNDHISLVAMAMAYIHTSAKAAIEKLYSHQRVLYKFFTPLTYMEFAHILRVVAGYIVRQEKVSTI